MGRLNVRILFSLIILLAIFLFSGAFNCTQTLSFYFECSNRASQVLLILLAVGMSVSKGLRHRGACIVAPEDRNLCCQAKKLTFLVTLPVRALLFSTIPALRVEASRKPANTLEERRT